MSIKHQIIQMIENSTGNYHYPVTLYEAIKDSSGLSFDSYLKELLNSLGVEYSDLLAKKTTELTKLIEDTVEKAGGFTESSVQEIRDSITLINRRMRGEEASVSLLSSYWLKGTLTLSVSNISSIQSRILYYTDDVTLITTPVPGDYAVGIKDPLSIEEYVGSEWVTVSSNDLVILYALSSVRITDRTTLSITSTEDLPVRGTDYDTIGDVHVKPSGEVFIWLGTTWSSISYPLVVESSRSLMDDLVDLTSLRSFEFTYATQEPIADYWYDGTTLHSSYPTPTVLEDFLVSLLPANYIDLGVVTITVYVGPKEPTHAHTRDVWVNTRYSNVKLNIGTDVDLPIWVVSRESSRSNLYTHSDTFNPYVDRELWRDIRTKVFSTQIPSDYVDGEFGTQFINSPNASLSQIVTLSPNSIYTYSCYLRPEDVGNSPNMYALVDGCEIIATNLIQGSLLDSAEFTLYYITFITGPQCRESTCRFESPSNKTYYMYKPCLQEGTSFTWSSSIKDVIPLLTPVLETKSSVVNLYRETDPADMSVDDLRVVNYGERVYRYTGTEWLEVVTSLYPTLRDCIDAVYSAYTESGVTRITTKTLQPIDPIRGDYWVREDLSVLRYTGLSWGTVTSVSAGVSKVLESTLQQMTDTQIRFMFMESSINPTDVYDLAQILDPTITYYEQGTEPVGATLKDLWRNTDTNGLYRYNGSEWVVYGGARISTLEQTIEGLTSDVGAIYENGGGVNLLPNSTSLTCDEEITEILSPLERDCKYVLSVESSSSTTLTTYRVRVMNATHTLDYGNKDFTVGGTLQLWRFTVSVPVGVTPTIVVTHGAGSLSLNHIKLEKGSVYSAWTPSLEDSDLTVGLLNSSIESLNSKLVSKSADIDLISQSLLDSIQLSNEALARSVSLAQTAESFNITSSAITRRVGDLEDTLDTYSSVFSFLPEGLKITSLVGGTPSDISTYYRSDGMYFWSESLGTDVGYVTANGLNIKNATVQAGGVFALGNFKWKPMTNGSVSLVYGG